MDRFTIVALTVGLSIAVSGNAPSIDLSKNLSVKQRLAGVARLVEAGHIRNSAGEIITADFNKAGTGKFDKTVDHNKTDFNKDQPS